jgi:DNA sulfur modification protein DndE
LSFNRIRLSKDASMHLRTLKMRTGLNPNILSRLAFCVSLGESGIPDSRLYDEEGLEFNRYTLTGEWDVFFISLLKERMVADGLDPTQDLVPYFKAHLNRGVMSLHTRVKGLADLVELIPAQDGRNPR